MSNWLGSSQLNKIFGYRIGTIPYMAPEQIQAQARTASDQYALGIVTYEWLAGERPFEGSYTEVAVKQLTMSPPPLRDKIPNLVPEVEQVILKALTKDPKQRFVSIQAFASALEAASQSSPRPSASRILPPPTAPASQLLDLVNPGTGPPGAQTAQRHEQEIDQLELGEAFLSEEGGKTVGSLSPKQAASPVPQKLGTARVPEKSVSPVPRKPSAHRVPEKSVSLVPKQAASPVPQKVATLVPRSLAPRPSSSSFLLEPGTIFFFSELFVSTAVLALYLWLVQHNWNWWIFGGSIGGYIVLFCCGFIDWDFLRLIITLIFGLSWGVILGAAYFILITAFHLSPPVFVTLVVGIVALVLASFGTVIHELLLLYGI